jgi:transcriptional regulator with XRE-family HTH domain
MRQVDFAEAIGVSRETVSHWENIGPDGNPRAMVRKRYSRVIASLVQQRLGESVRAGAFFSPQETAFHSLVKELRDVKQELGRLRLQIAQLASPERD